VAEAAQVVEQGSGLGFGEAAGRLVEDEDGRPLRQGRGDADHLPLGGGQVSRRGVRVEVPAQFPQGLARLPAPGAPVDAAAGARAVTPGNCLRRARSETTGATSGWLVMPGVVSPAAAAGLARRKVGRPVGLSGGHLRLGSRLPLAVLPTYADFPPDPDKIFL